jgi:flagellar hook-length control protein FliK
MITTVTISLAKPTPQPSTELSHQALALDKLTVQLRKTGPADIADTANTTNTTSFANAHSQTPTPTHLAEALKPLMDTPSNVVAQASVNTPFGKSGWTQAVAQQVMVMVKDKVQTISLALNPPNLGPLQVVVKIENQVANVQFSSAAPEVLQALREGLPVLQDMLGQAGVALGQADIGQRQPQRGQKNNPAKPNESSASPDAELIPSIHNAQTDLSYRQGLVNLYA